MGQDGSIALEQVEEFVRWLGRASALREVFPEYVLLDSSDYLAALGEINTRRESIVAIAEQINPGVARRIAVCLDTEDDLEATAIACQRLYLILEPEGHLNC
ncbi:MAG TPA: hypothetical protein VMU99_04965 [Acidimicrobiales bacterium]|nr:hypothetical protein [Acidimicrobiales bacterium]